MKPVLVAIASGMLLLAAFAATAPAAPDTNRIAIRYIDPADPGHREIYELLKERRTLERLQEFLGPFRLPRTLRISLQGCDGEADAFYGDDAITICHEYLDVLWKGISDQEPPAGIAPIDTVIGPLVDTALHEFAHALIDMFSLPVLGRMEDAADQVAAYIYLQLAESDARRLITGTAYAYFTEARNAEPQVPLTRFADDHGTPAQRAYNLLCMAYGADTEIYGDFVTNGYLPEDRAETCEEEYEQVQDALEMLLEPHVDRELGKELRERPLLREKETWSPHLRGSTRSD
jgi:hypothetical protein